MPDTHFSDHTVGTIVHHLAYVDPAAGGLLAQMLLGGTLGIVAFIRARIHRLRRTSTDPAVEAEAADTAP